MTDRPALATMVIQANPVPDPVATAEHLDAYQSLLTLIDERSGAMDHHTKLADTPTNTPPRPPRSRAPAWAFAAAFVLILIVVGGAVLLLRGDDTQVTDEPATSTTTAVAPTEPIPVESLTWTRVPHDSAVFHPTADDGMVDVVAGGPGFVAVGQTNAPSDAGWAGDAAVWTSSDGLTWTLLPNDAPPLGGPGRQSIESITTGGPGFVAVGLTFDGPDVGGLAATVWTSEDGVSWSKVPYGEAAFGSKIRDEPGGSVTWMHDVTEGGPGLVAVGSDAWSAAVWTSDDGIAWTRVPHDPQVFGHGRSSTLMAKVAGGASGLVAVGLLDERRAVWTSPDGLNWTVVPNGPDLSTVAATRFGFVGVGENETIENAAAVWTSPDGTTWSRVPHDEAVFGGGPDKQGMSDVITVGDQVVAVGTSVWVSPDGLTWSRVYHDPALTGEHHGGMKGVAAGPSNVVVIVGGDGASERRSGWRSRQSAVVWIGAPGQLAIVSG